MQKKRNGRMLQGRTYDEYPTSMTDHLAPDGSNQSDDDPADADDPVAEVQE